MDYGNEVFMIPETGDQHRVELWRATQFPYEWELEKTVFEGERCADTTLLEHDGTWWMFTNICRDSFDDFCSELHLFRVDGPELNSIEPHPLNPVVISTETARGAGRIFSQDGKLYRPSQDNTHGSYGYGLNIMEITELSMQSYSETRIRHIAGPEIPGAIGCHHVDSIGDQVVFDLRWP